VYKRQIPSKAQFDQQLTDNQIDLMMQSKYLLIRVLVLNAEINDHITKYQLKSQLGLRAQIKKVYE
jgi:hypothetical protein